MTDRVAIVEEAPQPKSSWPIILILLVGAVWFSNLDYRKLVRPDEGRYAEIAREMAATGNWITPRLNGTGYQDMQHRVPKIEATTRDFGWRPVVDMQVALRRIYDA